MLFVLRIRFMLMEETGRLTSVVDEVRGGRFAVSENQRFSRLVRAVFVWLIKMLQ